MPTFILNYPIANTMQITNLQGDFIASGVLTKPLRFSVGDKDYIAVSRTLSINNTEMIYQTVPVLFHAVGNPI